MLSRVLQINEKERNLFQHKSNKKSEERRKLCRRNSVVVRYLILLRHHYIVTAHKWTNSDFVNAILYMLCKTYIKDSLQDCVRLWRWLMIYSADNTFYKLSRPRCLGAWKYSQYIYSEKKNKLQNINIYWYLYWKIIGSFSRLFAFDIRAIWWRISNHCIVSYRTMINGRMRLRSMMVLIYLKLTVNTMIKWSRQMRTRLSKNYLQNQDQPDRAWHRKYATLFEVWR